MKPVFKLKNYPLHYFIFSYDELQNGKKVIWGSCVTVRDSVTGSFSYDPRLQSFPESELEPTNLPEKEALQELLNNYRKAFPLV